jgi:ABC-2 type transport system ATP-binding protein
MSAMIDVAGLTKSYGRKRGITDVTFQVQPGEVFGFMGPNGAGKTTTIRTLMALLRADSGSARVSGLDCWDQSVEVKRITGYLPGEPALDNGLTGGQILEYFGHLRGGVDQTYLKQLVERLGLDPTRKFHQYSSGNKRKVVLIQAFMHRPPVLILDEPTNGLDPLNQQEFARMVREVQAEGRTVFLSSHILGEVEEICTRVGIIREGQLVRVGDLAQLKDIKRSELTLVFANPVPADSFAGLPGVSSLQPSADGRTLHLELQGSADDVIKAAAAYPVVSISSHEPSLEDIFLRYYTADGSAPSAPTSGSGSGSTSPEVKHVV